MKKILFISIAFLGMVGCKKDLSGINGDSKHPLVVPSYTLFSNAERNVVDIVTSSSVNFNVFRLITQQWTQTTYTDESNYDLGTRNIPNNFWAVLYKNALKDFDEAKKLIPTDVSDVAVQKNEIAITDIMLVYTFSVLVNTYGDVPYSQALIADNFFPKYDDAKTIYNDLILRIDSSVTTLKANTAAGSFGSADLLYGGSVSKWIKFANSLKLRLGITLSDADLQKAKTTVESAYNSGLMTANEDNAMFAYLSSTPNTNPIWVDLVQSGRGDYVIANTLSGLMNSLSDPRRSKYFTKGPGDLYVGGVPGKGNAYGSFSHPGDALIQPNFPADIMDYAEVEFGLAEAVERGMNIPGTAKSHYDNAITASILAWGGTASEATAYLGLPAVNYLTAAGTYKQKIGIQKYLALYNRGIEAWTEQRRLDYPALVAPTTALSAYPVRFSYPTSEQNLNGSNYKAAATAIGGDLVTTKLFWDKF